MVVVEADIPEVRAESGWFGGLLNGRLSLVSLDGLRCQIHPPGDPLWCIYMAYTIDVPIHCAFQNQLLICAS